MAAAEYRDPWSWREKGEHRGLYNKNTSPKPLTGKMIEADYSEFFQPSELKEMF